MVRQGERGKRAAPSSLLSPELAASRWVPAGTQTNKRKRGKKEGNTRNILCYAAPSCSGSCGRVFRGKDAAGATVAVKVSLVCVVRPAVSAAGLPCKCPALCHPDCATFCAWRGKVQLMCCSCRPCTVVPPRPALPRPPPPPPPPHPPTPTHPPPTNSYTRAHTHTPCCSSLSARRLSTHGCRWAARNPQRPNWRLF